MAIHPDAHVDARAHVDASVVIWAGTQVREFAEIGGGTSLGQYVYVGPGAVIGANCKIQNGAMIYEPAVLADGVFVGPRVVLTNDRHPRAITPAGVGKTPADWTPVGVTIGYGASIGAGAVCVAPLTIGTWSTVAAGAVVVRDVPNYAIVAGVPAKRVGWVGPAGVPLLKRDDYWVCPSTGDRFLESGDGSTLSPAEK
jgi:UDP-2-acetamido-3-amino-2,3-dideoxy-glucuronate N-acetyltransferase